MEQFVRASANRRADNGGEQENGSWAKNIGNRIVAVKFHTENSNTRRIRRI